ncbi:MAG: hypothetical protein A2096_06310 [Spirochaetes bacterium GWF1_41_5]|nr:MAG: hypothetical protein A2096_06310 [Spirochaetes bacterium GWF1_41_5]HBE04702.1 hypothetical protein [Spirochaetia bacterium]
MPENNSIKLIKAANEQLVFSIIKKYGSLTKENIIRKTGLSRPTVISIINLLIKKSLLMQTGKEKSSVGRIPVLYGINTEKFIIGIDMEYLPVRIAVTDLNLRIKYNENFCLKPGSDSKAVIKFIINSVKGIISRLDLKMENAVGLGIGLPGLIDKKNHKSLFIERIAGWKNIQIKKIFSGFSVPVFFGNDVHLLAGAEQHKRQSVHPNFIFIGIRAGIGMGIFYNGKLLSGNMGNAGFIGHAFSEKQSGQCTCGKSGCLEISAGEDAIIKKYCTLTGENFPEKCGYDFYSGFLKKAISSADSGEKKTTEIIITAAERIGRAAADASLLFDINTVIIHGNLTRSRLFMNTVKKNIMLNTPDAKKEIIKIESSALTENEFALGACVLAAKFLMKNPRLHTGA